MLKSQGRSPAWIGFAVVGDSKKWASRRRSKNNKARLQALLLALARWADGARLRRLFPRAMRLRLHAAKKWLFHQPVRFSFDRGGTGEAVRLVVTGEPFADWLPALTAPETWRSVPSIAEVVLKLDDSPLSFDALPRATGCRTVLLPLRENAIAACPGGLGLYPSPDAVAILRDKRRFADYVTANGLAPLCPVNYVRREDIELPCIVKSAYDQQRAVVVRTQEELERLLAGSTSLPPGFAFQEFIAGTTEHTLHAIVRHGRPVWSASFAFEKEGDARVGVEFKTMTPFDPPPVVSEALEHLLRPLDYNGPCNMDYILRPSGGVAVFEINPRLGGTMFLPQSRPLLTEALTRLVAEA
ncbi:MAG: hypothetical protein JSS04_29135 [Proteobacteria bacterium]|nr:hypothetical protein [Pseudomonadota bacterium]